MMIHEITEQVGKYKARKRVGRGRSSGRGKTAGRGHKGHSSRSGFSRRLSFEGGQMPYFRRIAKRGFANTNFRTNFRIANLGDIIAHPDFANGGEVDADRLVKAGLIPDNGRPLKILGDLGEAKEQGLKVKLTITAERVTDSVRKMVGDAGGSVTEVGTRRDKVRGVERNSDDRTPKNLTKKPKLRAAKKFDGKGEKAGKGGKKKGGDAADTPEEQGE